MVARLQGFPDSWEFSGRKTAAYRQVGNAFPPPVAAALGTAIAAALGQAHPRRRPRAGQRARLERTDVRPAATAGLDESAGTSSGLSLPTVTARRSSDTRYPPFCTVLVQDHLVADGVHNGHSVAVGGCPAGARVPRARAAGTCWTAASWPLAGAGAELGSGSGRGPARPDRRMPSPLPRPAAGRRRSRSAARNG